MMCAYLLAPRREDRHGRLYRAGEQAFAAILDVYDRSLNEDALDRKFGCAKSESPVRAGRRAACRVRRRPSCGEPEVPRTAGPSPPAADDRPYEYRDAVTPLLPMTPSTTARICT